MIKINDTYCITVDPLNYAVCKDYHKKDKKGRPITSPVGYFDSLPKALEFILKRSAADALCSDDEISLKEAIEIISAKYNEVASLIHQAVPEARFNPSSESVRARK